MPIASVKSFHGRRYSDALYMRRLARPSQKAAPARPETAATFLIEELIAGIAEVSAGLWTVGEQLEFRGCGSDVDRAPNNATLHVGSVL